ncbi:hypothetical protein LSH36_10g11014 [Paralvinella palmiformis]|uniref:Methyltransferase-like protein 23 n=1 Tax=Paralvinella palmiformis TaxID=53620 RepID=A0AAD9KDR5_9ANNE|nr:hypothetical protein LSH36_10g11014 [Paralvinella palmiformis]
MSATSLRRFEFKCDYDLGSITICIPEVLDKNYGLYVWPCAPVLAQYVWKNRDRIKGRNILELGAGTSLPGILAAKLGAIVTLSDALHLPRCIDNCQKACAANNLESSIRVIGLTWGQFSPDLVQIGPLDVILGSDCFYNSKDFEDIIVTVSYLLDKNPQCEFWTTYQERSSDRTILPLLEKWNMYSRSIPLKDFDGANRNLAGSTLPGDHTIHMLVIRKKQ